MYHHHHRQPLMDVAASFLMQQFAPPSHSSSPHHHQPLHYNYFDRAADHSRRIPLQSSFVRSSAPRQMQHFASSSQALPSSYRSTFSMESSSSSTGSFAQDGSPLGSPYEVPNTDFQPPAVTGGQPYPTEAYPQSWPQIAQQSPTQYADVYSSTSYELPSSAPSNSTPDSNMMQVVKAEDSLESYSGANNGLYLAPYDDQMQSSASIPNHQNSLSTYSLSQYNQEVVSQQPLNYNYGAEPQSHRGNADVAGVSPYMLAASTQMQFADEDMPQFVNPTQVSPAISPMSPYAQLQELPQDQSCDPRFTMAGGAIPGTAHSPSAFTDFELDSGSGSVSGSPALAPSATSAPIPVPAAAAQRKRQRTVSFTSASEDEDAHGSSVDGESERDDDEGDGDDDEYQDGPLSPRTRRRAVSTSSTSPSTSTGSFSMARRLAPPVPVPNLTKKSRGRRVPTAQQVGTQGGAQKRMYMCKVPGCGKCFARGEHLKRHVRSIHTNEKRESMSLHLVLLHPSPSIHLLPSSPSFLRTRTRSLTTGWVPQRTSAPSPDAARTLAATTTWGSTCASTRASQSRRPRPAGSEC
ncbi:hypothetical protein C8Q77DRAFT_118497 [Trametes polyzona]|nr:hypothetical protein C8Q77DRAFT_118497 [Trametes polyzona]